MDKQQEFVLRTIEERGVKFIRLWFTDVAGTLKSVAVLRQRLRVPSPRESDLMVRPSKDWPEPPRPTC